MTLFRTRIIPEHSGNTATNNPNTASTAFREFLKHPTSLLLLLAAIVFGAIRSQQGAIAWTDAAACLALLLLWPVLEWLIHVVLLHNKPRRIFGRQIDFLLPQTHRWHHADPWNLHLVFIPLHVLPIVAPLLIGGAYLLLPTATASSYLAAYFLLALHYEWVHYLAHINWCPPLTYYRRRVQEHRWHHFKNENQWWGVSMGSGDRLFGTAPAFADVERSANTKNILGAPHGTEEKV